MELPVQRSSEGDVSHRRFKRELAVPPGRSWRGSVDTARLVARVIVICFAVLTSLTGISSADETALSEEVPSHLKQLSLEELMNVEVSTVYRRQEKWRETAAAVFVITSEDIRRSGATSIAEALRLAPGVHVARVNSNQWAIAARGFADRLNRTILTLQDGRSLYSPLDAGTHWDVQDTLLEDIDHIEVVRGTGGTLWGANALNGIINVITKSAKDTQGVYVSGGGGSQEQGFGSVRYGGKIGEFTSYRIYGKYFDRAGEFSPGLGAFDGWNMGRVGFRSDSDLKAGDGLTLQGDLYDGSIGQRDVNATYSPPFQELVQRDADASGGNLLGRWKHQTGEESDLSLQAYYDYNFRRESRVQERRNTYDLDLQHSFRLPWEQGVTWGLGYRLSSDHVGTIPTIRFIPASRDEHLFTGFLEDEISLLQDSLRVTLGSKLERNFFTGFEFQPGARLLWKPVPTSGHVVWAAVTRAVRTPSRVERDASVDFFGGQLPASPPAGTAVPVFARLIGDGQFGSEKALAYEIGYRPELSKILIVDLTAFYTRYSNLFSAESTGGLFVETSPSPPHVVAPVFFRNRMDGEGWGSELSATATVFDWWRVGGSYSYLQTSLWKERGSQDPRVLADLEGLDPQHEVRLRSLMNPLESVELDAQLRYVDHVRDPSEERNIPRYVTLDLHVGWRPIKQLELSAVGQNLLQDHHGEFRGGLPPIPPLVEVKRGGYGRVTWRW